MATSDQAEGYPQEQKKEKKAITERIKNRQIKKEEDKKQKTEGNRQKTKNRNKTGKRIKNRQKTGRDSPGLCQNQRPVFIRVHSRVM